MFAVYITSLAWRENSLQKISSLFQKMKERSLFTPGVNFYEVGREWLWARDRALSRDSRSTNQKRVETLFKICGSCYKILSLNLSDRVGKVFVFQKKPIEVDIDNFDPTFKKTQPYILSGL